MPQAPAPLPSPWARLPFAVVLLALPLTWRWAGWWLRDAFADPRRSLRDVVKGNAWDLSIGVAALALVLAAGQLRGRWHLAARAVLVAAAVGSQFVRCIDTSQCYLGHTHFTADSFMFWDTDWIAGRRDAPVLGLAAGFFASAVFAIWAVVRLSRRWPARWRPWAWCAAGLTLLPAAWALRDGVRYPAHAYSLRLVAEVNFAQQLDVWLNPPKIDTAALVHLPRERADRFVRAGLMPQTPLFPEYPLSRAGLDEPPLPLPRKPGVAADARPNVVLTMVESLSRTFVHELSGHYRGLMPKVSALARQSTAIDGYRNTTAPTIAGLILTLCSLHAPSHPRDLQPGQRMDRNTPFVCMPDVLRQAGYRTVFVQTTALEAMGIEAFLRTHGFDEVIGRPQVREKRPGRPEGPFGPHDDTLVDVAIDVLRTLEAERAKDGRPFLLVVLTIDTHEPGMAPARCQVPPTVTDAPAEAGPRKVLAAFHCTDDQLGRWHAFLAEPPRAKDTLWMLTGDHSVLNTLNTRPLFRGPGDGIACSPGVWLIGDPLHDLPPRPQVVSGSQDVAPTLLHLLGLHTTETTMTGHSVFGRRPQFPLVLGRVGGRTAFVQWGAHHAELSADELRQRCAGKEALLGVGVADPPDFDACDFAAWLGWQDGLWDAKRLFPQARYKGDAFADKRRLDAEATLDW
ncbi:MAG: sulfatase-like hydrolase/transferase [Deltaproteobacteria bacterium]|nr:sulfatase-like hydrolase/transferase [Deltaproteobacteria bacterium]